ncbi:MAG: AAA family ATPase [Patescibacteria group bacterium]
MLKGLELHGFKSFDRKTKLDLGARVSAIVGPNGSGKSNVAEALRWVLGEQSMKSVRGKRGEDLIFNGSKTIPRQNRAAVSLTFDNRARRIPIEFDDVIVSREVYRDGTNRYLVNGSVVRLKDILELLSSIGIGGTSYHIISQGEADRLLMAKPDMRREMIEEALGLNIYQYKIKETVGKRLLVEKNLKEAVMLRRELLPQLRYLAAEIEKLERFYAVRDELTSSYVSYFALERDALSAMRTDLDRQEIFFAEKQLEYPEVNFEAGREQTRALLFEKEQLVRSLGRIEGVIAAAKSMEDEAITADQFIHEQSVSGQTTLCRTCGQLLPEALGHTSDQPPVLREEGRAIFDIEALSGEKNELESRLAGMEAALVAARAEEGLLRERIARRSELSRAVARLEEEKRGLVLREEQFHADLRDAITRVGRPVLAYENITAEESGLDLATRRRELERLAIRFEELGSIDESIRAEHAELARRDLHLSSQIEDLKNSEKALGGIMSELSMRIEREFEEGIQKINGQFGEFFGVLFGGGEAALSRVLISDEGEAEEYGLDVAVSLPHKRVKSLQLLSGGERSLASIALLFAMSQVNPPPFLVLDETDAALDESNSRRYGDMLDRLSGRSQLIVITHNRETMARAHLLYGVTMAGDGTSRVLSVQFEK